MMSLNHFSVLLIALIFVLSECQDFCPLVRPNNEYKGLGIYHFVQKAVQNRYFMYNKEGQKWRFSIYTGGLPFKEWRIQMIRNSVEKFANKGVINMFGITFEDEKNLKFFVNCVIKERVISLSLH